MRSILLVFMLVYMVGCSTFTVAPHNPPINNDKFENYVPWWATNKTEVVTNKTWEVMDYGYIR